jgi:hypothetical protein
MVSVCLATPIAIFGRPGLDQYTCVCVLRYTNNRATLHLLIRVACVGNTLWVFRVHTRKESPLTVHVDEGDAWAIKNPSEWEALTVCVQSMCRRADGERMGMVCAANMDRLLKLSLELRRALELVRRKCDGIPQLPGHLWDDICLRALPSWALRQPLRPAAPAATAPAATAPPTGPATAAPATAL